MAGNIFNSQGIHVAVVVGTEIFDLTGRKLMTLFLHIIARALAPGDPGSLVAAASTGPSLNRSGW